MVLKVISTLEGNFSSKNIFEKALPVIEDFGIELSTKKY